MADPKPAEVAHFQIAAEIENRLRELTELGGGSYRFARDCDAILEAQWTKAGPGSRNYLPLAALLRLARHIGMEQVRYVEALLRPKGSTFFNLRLTVRKDVAKRRSLRAKQLEGRMRLQIFGERVLELERQGCGRWEALSKAGRYVRLTGSGRSYLEAQFRKFNAVCLGQGYIGTSSALGRMEPRFALADLKARQGRPPKSSHGSNRRSAKNDLVFPPFKR